MVIRDYFISQEQFEDIVNLVDELQEFDNRTMKLNVKYHVCHVDADGNICSVKQCIYNTDVERFPIENEDRIHIVSWQVIRVKTGEFAEYKVDEETAHRVCKLQDVMRKEALKYMCVDDWE